jgi:hypothetical protein
MPVADATSTAAGGCGRLARIPHSVRVDSTRLVHISRRYAGVHR